MKTSIISILSLVAFVLFIRTHPVDKSTVVAGNQDTTAFYPADVKKVIDDKCYGCHSIKGKLQKAKDKLMWDSLPGLSKRKMVATLGNIVDELDKNDMPPEEFLKKFPDAALVPGQKELLTSWAGSKADNLLK